jgi:YtkA-like
MRGVFAGAGLLVLGMLAWGHLGLGALIFPPANAASVQTAMAGPYQVSFARPASGFTVGKDNTSLITIRGSNGAQLEGAQVSVRQEMTTMAMSVPPTKVTAQGNGRYETRMAFAMAGSWRVTIIIARAGQAQSQVAFDAGVRWK